MKKKWLKVLSLSLVLALETTSIPLVSANTQENQTNSGDVKNQVLNLKFEGNLEDSSPEGNHGTLRGHNGSTTLNYQYTEGIIGQAMELKGNTYIDLGKSTTLQPQNLTLSFWINPKEKMTNEQLITWSKTAYNSDGWYLSSEGDSVPLAISIGPAAGQPYKVSIQGTRDSFFPSGIWTHIAVTYDSKTKAVIFYRNGIKQDSTITYAVSTSATGVLGSNSSMMKSIGFNGTQYNGSYLKAALDEYQLYNDAATQSQVIKLYEMSGYTFDRIGLAQADADALSILSSTAGNLLLPTNGPKGSAIIWETSNSNFIDTNGIVIRPEEGCGDEVVTLTALVSFDGCDPIKKSFKVTVYAQTGSDHIKDSGMGNVSISDAYLENAASKEKDYLLSLSSKKFLYEFYKVAGLTPPAEAGYEGWERSNGTNFRGHTMGHYLSALSQLYLSYDDENIKSLLLEQMKDAVNGLLECQTAYGTANPASAGYLSAFRESILDKVQGTVSYSDENVIVPWYNLHSILAGLIDVSQNVDNLEISRRALQIAENFGEYIYNRLSKLPSKTQLLSTEYGGMNEALYKLYDITGNVHYKEAAQYFDEVSLFDQLAANNDVLNGKHANTTIPKLTSALKRYTVLTENEDYYNALTTTEKNELSKYLKAAENFWQIVVDHHTYVTGGNSQSEHFHSADSLYQYATQDTYGNTTTCETCNTYNMLKLTRELFKLTKDKKYTDYYENTYINAILSSQNPETGMTMYFQPMAPGYSKIFHRPFDEFWCCTGTGMESFSKLGDSIYFTDNASVYVNMFFSSQYEYETQNLKLTQFANIPNEDIITFMVDAIDGEQVSENTTLRLRIPDWLADELSIAVNGEKIENPTITGGYVLVKNIRKGDVIEYTLPMEVRVHATKDNANFIAFKYGPVVLSTALSTKNVEASQANGILVRVATFDKEAQTGITVKDGTTAQWIKNAAENLIRIEDSEDGQVQFKLINTDSESLIYTPHFMRYKERYGLYMNLEEPDSIASQDRILANKDSLRQLEICSDYLYNFDNNNSEFAKNMKCSPDSTVGLYADTLYRDARANGWFSYDLKINPNKENSYLKCTYYSGDRGRTFDIYINGEKFKTVTITNTAGTNVFYIETDQIPSKYLKNPVYKMNDANEYILDEEGNKIPIVNVMFKSTGSYVGGLFGISITSADSYDTNAGLASLRFNTGKLSPEFNSDTTQYTLTVPVSTNSVNMMVSPNMPSGLVYADDILFDDTIERLIKLPDDSKELIIKAVAQDHITAKIYRINIVKSGELEIIDDKDLEDMNLTELIEKALEELTKTDIYTASSLENLEDAIRAAQAGVNSPYPTVAESVRQDLIAAIKKLELLPTSEILTLDELKTLFAKARILADTEGVHTQSSRQELADFLDEFESYLEGSLTDDAIEFMTKAINELINALAAESEPAVIDKDGLLKVICDAEELSGEDYTSKSWESMQTILRDAKEIYVSETKDQKLIDTAVETLQEEIEALVDLRELKAAIARETGTVAGNYTLVSWYTAQIALYDAKAVLAKSDAAAVEVNAATHALNAAFNKLVVKVNKNNLKTAIDKVASFDTTSYTTISVLKMKLALNDALKVYNGAGYTQGEVDAVTLALNNAVEALVLQVNKAKLKELITSTSAIPSSNYSFVSWYHLRLAISAATSVVNDVNATQAQVNEQVELLKAAEAALAAK